MQMAYSYCVKGYIQYSSRTDLIIEAEGEEEQLNNFTAWLQSGSVWAKIKSIQIKETAIKNYTAFDIRHGTIHSSHRKATNIKPENDTNFFDKIIKLVRKNDV